MGVFVTLVALGGQWALHRSPFLVEHVTVRGVRHESSVAVLRATGFESHPPMIAVNDGVVERRLSVFPWISSVSVSKHWPNTVVVTVHETTAVAVAFNATKVLQYVNAQGRDLGRAPITVNLPTLVYLDPRNSAWPFAIAGRSAALVASQLPRAFASQVDQIIVDAHGAVTLKMTTPVRFVLGPATNLRAKFVAIASVIAHTTLRPGDVVDVTVPDELAVTGPAPS